MSITDMKGWLINAPKYNQSEQARITWERKVRRMSDSQIIAIYFRMARAGELGKGDRRA